jgi:hypothetical protein
VKSKLSIRDEDHQSTKARNTTRLGEPSFRVFAPSFRRKFKQRAKGFPLIAVERLSSNLMRNLARREKRMQGRLRSSL